MKHVKQSEIEAAVEKTAARLERVVRGEDPMKDVLNVVSRHFTMIGQHGLAEQIDDFVVDYTSPAVSARVAS